MGVVEIFIRSTGSLDVIARKLRDILNIPDRNRTSYRLDQRREGINHGGVYYHFETLGLDIELLANMGEVEISNQAQYPFYLLVYCDHGTLEDDGLRLIAAHIAEICSKAGLEMFVLEEAP